MGRIGLAFAALALAFAFATAEPALAQKTPRPQGSPEARPEARIEETVWTMVVGGQQSSYVFTWRLREDGTYLEDGRDARTGQSIQPTLTGRWSRSGGRMTMQQDGSSPFKFEGLIAGRRYSGTMTLRGERISTFCAAQGDDVPRCEDLRVV
jgi:hypothetical protein